MEEGVEAVYEVFRHAKVSHVMTGGSVEEVEALAAGVKETLIAEMLAQNPDLLAQLEDPENAKICVYPNGTVRPTTGNCADGARRLSSETSDFNSSRRMQGQEYVVEIIFKISKDAATGGMDLDAVADQVTAAIGTLAADPAVQGKILDAMQAIADADPTITFDRDAVAQALQDTLSVEKGSVTVASVDEDTIDSGDGLGAGVIVGIVIGSLAGVALLVFFFIFMQSRMKR